MKLYELADNFRQAEDLVNSAESDAELKEAIDYLTETESELVIKFENIAKFIRNLEAEEEAYKAEADRLTKLAKSRRHKIDGLKDYLKYVMETEDLQKINGDLFTVSLRNNSNFSVNVVDESHIPKEYFVEHKPTVDKRKLLDHMKTTGEVFEGVEVRKGKHIRIS